MMMSKISFKLKKCAAAVCAALMLSAPLTAEAHFLSSRQEKEIGNAAVADFKKQYRTYSNPVLTRIQERLLEWNPDKLWMYGTPGKKRGLEPVLESDKNEINAVSYGGGQIFVYKPMVDFLASDQPGVYWSEKNNPQHLRPYKMSNLYQMSALASVIGHEMGHWENEDMLRMHDKQMYTKLIAAAIPVGNVWAMLGVAAGSNLINAFNSRQMGFRTEEQADEKGREYCEMVPEYSIGGDAIYHYRMYLYKKAQGTENEVNWLHPHSKSGKRLERALNEMKKSSRGFYEWKGLALDVNGKRCSNEEVGVNDHPAVPSSFERHIYVTGQIATAIKYDFARTRNIEVMPENEVFTDGSPNNTTMLLRGRGTDGKNHVKVVDTYRGVSVREAQAILAMGYEEARSAYNNSVITGEKANLAGARIDIEKYELNLKKYGPRGTNALAAAEDEGYEDDPSK